MFTVFTGPAQHEEKDKNSGQIIENQDLPGLSSVKISINAGLGSGLSDQGDLSFVLLWLRWDDMMVWDKF